MARRRKPGGLTHTITLPERHPGQLRLIAEREKFNVAAMGRRWGKTQFGLDLALEGYGPDDPGALMNGGRVGWWVGEQAHFTEVWDEVSQALDPISRKQDAAAHYIRLYNGARLDFWTLFKGPNAGRGRKYHRALVDEAAYAKWLEKAWQRTILPTLTDYKGDAWFMSSPNGKNYFSHLHALGNVKSPFYRGGWKSFQEPSWNNPHIDPEVIESFRLEMTDNDFRQEYGAEFIEGEGGWFKRDWLRWYHTQLPVDQMVRVILCDPASGEHKTDGEDYTVFWVLGLNDDRNYYVLDFVRERYDVVERTAMLFALHRHYRPQYVGYERVGMQSDVQHIRERMEMDHYRFDITELNPSIPKPIRIKRLVPPFKQGRIWFPSEQVRGSMVQAAHRVLKLWIEIEFLTYPSSENDDGLDGLASIFDVGAEFGSAGPRQDEAPDIYRPSMGSVLSGSF